MPKNDRGNTATVSPPAVNALARGTPIALWLAVRHLYELATGIRDILDYSCPLFLTSPSVKYFLFVWRMKKWWSFGNIFEACIIAYLLFDSDTHVKKHWYSNGKTPM